jgi:hypothetical protein
MISAPDSAPEFLRGETVFEGLVSVHSDDRNLEPVEFVSLRVLFYIHLCEAVFVCDSGGPNLRLGFFAQVAAGLCIERDVWFCSHGLYGGHGPLALSEKMCAKCGERDLVVKNKTCLTFAKRSINSSTEPL